MTFLAAVSSFCERHEMRGFFISKWFKSCRVCRVSSQAITSTILNVSRTRKVISQRFPIGVPTIYKTGTYKIYMEIKIRATLKQKMNGEEKIGLSAGAVRSSHWNVAQRSEAAERE